MKTIRTGKVYHYNAVLLFGATGWKGVEVVLWQLGIKVVVEQGN